MGRLIKRTPATYADVEAAPEHLVAELIDGTLYLSPRPALPHAHASAGLAGDLFGPFHRGRGGPGGWIILQEPELHIAGVVMVPDLAGWRRDRGLDLTAKFAELSPDWVCEVASPSTAALDRKVKMPRYAQAGVRHLWILDPLAELLEVFRLVPISISYTGIDAPPDWRIVGTYSEDDKVRAEPFEAIELDLAELWAR